MITLITYIDEKDKKTEIVSHGVDVDTLENVVLQQMPLSCYRYKFDRNYGNILEEDAPELLKNVVPIKRLI